MPGDILVFTLHKSASMFIHQQCEFLCGAAGLEYHSPNLPASGLSARRLLTDPTIWSERHGCFAPLRFFIDIPRLEEYAIILHLRDPRDVLVSMFYSYCFTHPGELAPNTGYRREVAERGIDDFVIAKSSERSGELRGDYGSGGHIEELIGNVPHRYGVYLTRLLSRPNVTLVRYEDMVTDYRAWLEKFIVPFPLPEPVRLVDELALQAPLLFPKRERDALSHIRHVAPGDYRQKLKTSTIARLNETFAVALERLGYER